MAQIGKIQKVSKWYIVLKDGIDLQGDVMVGTEGEVWKRFQQHVKYK